MNKKMTVVGGGIIGAGLAVNALMHDFDVCIYDIRPAEELEPGMRDIFSVFVNNELCSREQADAWLDKVRYTNDMKAALEGVGFVQECVSENPDVKHGVYRQIQEVVGDQAIIASSTSMLLPSELQKDAMYPECIMVGHPFNPSYLLPLVEICGSDEAKVKEAVAYYTEMGKKPIVCHKEKFGLIANAVSLSAMKAAKDAILDGLCSVEEMDQALMYGPGLRMAVTGQILAISLGVKGGMRAMGAKYGKVNPEDLILADGVDEELAHRPEELGRDHESVAAFRDKMIVKILQEQGML